MRRDPRRGGRSDLSEVLPLWLGLLFAIEVIVLGWAPLDREAWLMENLIAIPMAIGLLVGRRRIGFSTLAWWCVFLFLMLHEVGSHYTYSQVPWMDWSQHVLGWDLDFERNHYDRFVHFSFGLLGILPVTEALRQAVVGRRVVLQVLALCIVIALSGVYELLEFGAAVITAPDLGIAFVGAQGDPWDAQKDSGLALAGSLLGSLGIVFWTERGAQ